MFTTEAITALISLTFMEIVLGIDNIIFITILTARLPAEERKKGRNMGIAFALLTRLALLFSISWIMGMTEPLVVIGSQFFSLRDFILIAGGLFLIFKATKEVHEKIEGGHDEHGNPVGPAKNFAATVIQIMILDLVFSLDSVITAVGMAQHIEIMVAAMVISMIVMLASAGAIGGFVERHPTIKILALAFLILIGVVLLAEGMKFHIDKNYIYFAMLFAFSVELVNMRYRRKKPK
jgi:predicted tellurium resistance membrane protein TerC